MVFITTEKSSKYIPKWEEDSSEGKATGLVVSLWKTKSYADTVHCIQCPRKCLQCIKGPEDYGDGLVGKALAMHA